MSKKTRKVKVNMQQLQEGASNIGKGVQQTTDVVSGAIDQVGNTQNAVDSGISNIVNPILKMGNDAVRGFSAKDLFETDPTSAAELITESFQLVQNIILATQMTLKRLVGLNNDAQKDLIQLSQKGDSLCDGINGVKMTIALPNMVPPFGHTRWFDACIETKTMENVIKKLNTAPLEPINHFVSCALSEDILKPLDSLIVDTKNSLARTVKTITNLSQVQQNIRSGAQTITNGLEKFLAGTYTMYPNPDAITCFQRKMNGMDHPMVGGGKIIKDLADFRFITGKEIPPVKLGSKAKRNFCPL